MNYYELNLIPEPCNEAISEIVIAEFADLNFDSFVESEEGIKAYISAKLFNENDIKNTIKDLDNLCKISYSVKLIEAQNWNALWESNFDPIVINNKCTIRAPFHENLAPTEFEIVIMPKMSFGTGHHSTTYLVAEALLDMDVNNLKVLDMGCGTGILAILAAMKNATTVDAIDIDSWVYENAIENVEQNKMQKQINVMIGDASLLQGKTYDLILANINRNILLNDMQYYYKALVDGGRLIVSGILPQDIEAIEKEGNKLGLKKTEEKTRNQWSRVQFQK